MVKQRQRVTITFDLAEQPEAYDNSQLTWGKLREIIGWNTPAADNLEVREGLTGTIWRDTAFGEIRVSMD